MKKHKLLAVLLALAMALSLLPTAALAANEFAEMTIDGVTTQYNDPSAFFADLNAAEGKTIKIKLLDDLEIAGTVPIKAGQIVTFDLNGKKLSTSVSSGTGIDTRHYYAIDNHGDFTLEDTLGGGAIVARGIENLGDGTMVIKSGKIESCDSNGGACIWNEADLTINGGAFIASSTSATTNYGAGCLSNSGTATITAGTFTGNSPRTYAIISTGAITITPAEGKTVTVAGTHGGLAIDSGTAVVNGGSYSSTDYYGLYVSNDGVGTDPMTAAVTVNDGTFTGPNYAVWIGSDYNDPVNSTIEINGGVYQKPLNAQECTREGAIVVKGGTFSADPTAYVASGYHTAQSGSSYTVHARNVTHVAAKDPTCTETGNEAYYTCSGLGCENVYYTDENCASKYTLDQVVLAALGHSMKTEWSKDETQHWHECSRTGCTEKTDIATHTLVKTAAANGEYTFTCSVCGYTKTGTADDRTITTSAVTKGTVVAAPNPAKVGDTVTLTLTPNQGYGEAQLLVNGEALSGTTFTMPDADVTVTGTFAPIVYTITYNLNGGTIPTTAVNPTSYTAEDTFTLVNPTRNGYTFEGWNLNKNTGLIPVVTIEAGKAFGDITFTANWSRDDDDDDDDDTGTTTGGGGGGSSTGSGTTTTTEKNDDGSTTTTTTDKTTGTVTETTKNTDGSTTTVETKKDGTVTETNKTADGTTGTVVTDKNGEVTEAKASVSTAAATKAAKTGAAVTLPVEVPAAKTTDDAPAVEVTLSKSTGSVKVEIPVEQVTPGTVAVIVNADGTEKIVSTSTVTQNGVALTLAGNATVKIIDNAKSFTDVPATNVFYNEISSLSAREIMVGKTENTFDLYNSVTLNQVSNVAGRITGDVDVTDYNAGITWGKEKGLKTGDEAATRGDLLKALYIAAGSPAVEDTGILAFFKDADSIPEDLIAAAAWAAKNSILKGDQAGYANLLANVTRGQACALAGRTLGTLA